MFLLFFQKNDKQIMKSDRSNTNYFFKEKILMAHILALTVDLYLSFQTQKRTTLLKLAQ